MDDTYQMLMGSIKLLKLTRTDLVEPKYLTSFAFCSADSLAHFMEVRDLIALNDKALVLGSRTSNLRLHHCLCRSLQGTR